MGSPSTPKLEKRVAVATPDSDEVKQAGDAELERLRKKQGRGSTFLSNPAMQTGFSGGFAKQTGGV